MCIYHIMLTTKKFQFKKETKMDDEKKLFKVLKVSILKRNILVMIFSHYPYW